MNKRANPFLSFGNASRLRQKPALYWTTLMAAGFVLFLALLMGLSRPTPASAQTPPIPTIFPTLPLPTPPPPSDTVIYLPIITNNTLPPPPPDPVCEGGSCKFYVVPAEVAQSTPPVVFIVPTANFTEIPPQADAPYGGYHVTGNLRVETLLGNTLLAEADLIIERGDDSALAGLERVHGRAELPFPRLEFADLGVAQSTTMAEVGLDRGKNLTALDAPLLPNRQYLFFHTEQNIAVDLNPIPGETAIDLTYELSAGTTFLLDPLDPSFYFDGVGIPDFGTYALGRSVNGLIPYQPNQSAGVETEIVGFNGHQYDRLAGVGVPVLPVTVDGAAVINYGSLDLETPCVDCLFEPSPMFDPAQGIFNEIVTTDRELGLNGDLAFALPLPGDFNIEVWGDPLLDFSLGDASAVARYRPAANQVSLAFSGMMEPTTLIPDILVIQPNAQVTTYGVIDTALDTGEVEDFYIILEGDLSVAGVDLGSNGQIRIDQSGLSASTGVEFPVIIPAVTASGKKVKFDDDTLDIHINACIITGELVECSTLFGDGIKHPDWGNVCIPLSIGSLPNCTVTITPEKKRGDVKGTVIIEVDKNSLSGRFEAKHCLSDEFLGEICIPLSDGTVTFGSSPEACIYVPVVSKEVCVEL